MNEIDPVIRALTGDSGWLASALTWMATARLVLKPFAEGFQRKLSEAVSSVAVSPDPDDDALIVSILKSPAYRIAAFMLDLIASIKLPSMRTFSDAAKAQQ